MVKWKGAQTYKEGQIALPGGTILISDHLALAMGLVDGQVLHISVTIENRQITCDQLDKTK